MLDDFPALSASQDPAPVDANDADGGWQNIFLWWPSQQWCDTRRGVRRQWLLPGRCWRRFSERRHYFIYRR